MAVKTKKCKGCKKHRRISQFTAAVTTVDKLMVYCRACVKKYNQKYYQTNKTKLLDRANRRHRVSKEKQNG